MRAARGRAGWDLLAQARGASGGGAARARRARRISADFRRSARGAAPKKLARHLAPLPPRSSPPSSSSAMAQGFKPTKVSKAPKTRSGKATPSGPKRGPKVIAPKKTAAVKRAGEVRVSETERGWEPWEAGAEWLGTARRAAKCCAGGGGGAAAALRAWQSGWREMGDAWRWRTAAAAAKGSGVTSSRIYLWRQYGCASRGGESREARRPRAGWRRMRAGLQAATCELRTGELRQRRRQRRRGCSACLRPCACSSIVPFSRSSSPPFLFASSPLTPFLATQQKQTASLTSRIETEMAGRASRGGPLSIMKAAADGAAAERAAAEKKRKEKGK